MTFKKKKSIKIFKKRKKILLSNLENFHSKIKKVNFNSQFKLTYQFFKKILNSLIRIINLIK